MYSDGARNCHLLKIGVRATCLVWPSMKRCQYLFNIYLWSDGEMSKSGTVVMCIGEPQVPPMVMSEKIAWLCRVRQEWLVVRRRRTGTGDGTVQR